MRGALRPFPIPRCIDFKSKVWNLSSLPSPPRAIVALWRKRR